MCGSTDQMQNITDEQQAMYKTLNDNYTTMFGQEQAVLGALTSSFTPILNAGPSQTGFSPSEENALRTQNTEAVATNYAQSQRAAQQVLASRGGGNDFLPSSIDANITAQTANQAAAQRAAGENQITQANYAQGYQNWQAATNALSGVAGLMNPNAYAGSATGAGSAASTSAYQVAQANTSPWTAAIGALGSAAGLAAGGYFGRKSG